VVEDYVLIDNGNASGDEVTQGTDNLRRFHVSAGVIVPAHDTDARMLAVGFQEKIVEEREIIVVVGNEHTGFANGMTKVNGILRSGNPQVGWKQHIVAIAAQELHEQRKDAVIDQIQPHCRKILA
jgi:hypothetical protein